MSLTRRRRYRGRTRRAPAAVVVVALLLAACWALASLQKAEPEHYQQPQEPRQSQPQQPQQPQQPIDAPTAIAQLETIPVKGRAPKTGYDREEQFGTPWLDVDRNGCDTRNDILARDLTSATLAGPCKVTAGTLADPYTGTTIAFVRGDTTSTLVQIDHVVALSNAWQSGAQQLTADERTRLANDPRNLLAVDGHSNQSKGDRDAATWLPANTGFRCSYVARQVEVKAAYRLWVTPAEHAAMRRILASCA